MKTDEVVKNNYGTDKAEKEIWFFDHNINRFFELDEVDDEVLDKNFVIVEKTVVRTDEKTYPKGLARINIQPTWLEEWCGSLNDDIFLKLTRKFWRDGDNDDLLRIKNRIVATSMKMKTDSDGEHV